MLATATHDTKRGEDARLRLDALSEIPEEWQGAVSRWGRLNAGRRTRVEGEWAPDRNEEYLYYQTLLGVWPAGVGPEAGPALVERLQVYLVKALREAKLHSSWTNVDEAWERAVTGFVERTLAGPRSRRFLDSFVPLQRRIALLGAASSIAQLVLKIAAPGVPDFYQGTELWDLSLVDPDNRRAVDFKVRRELLGDLEPLLRANAGSTRREAVASMLENWPDGRIKLFVTACGLRMRREHAALLLDGSYEPVEAVSAQDGIVAFLRRAGDRTLLSVASRLRAGRFDEHRPFAGSPGSGAHLALPADLRGRRFSNVLTGETCPVDRSGRLDLESPLGLLPATWLLV